MQNVALLFLKNMSRILCYDWFYINQLFLLRFWFSSRKFISDNKQATLKEDPNGGLF